MRLGTTIGLCALALAAVMLGGCKSTAVAETKEIQTQRTKDLTIVLMNEKGELAMGQNRFVIAFRSASNIQPVDVGAVTVSSAMAMPGMAMPARDAAPVKTVPPARP